MRSPFVGSRRQSRLFFCAGEGSWVSPARGNEKERRTWQRSEHAYCDD